MGTAHGYKTFPIPYPYGYGTRGYPYPWVKLPSIGIHHPTSGICLGYPLLCSCALRLPSRPMTPTSSRRGMVLAFLVLLVTRRWEHHWGWYHMVFLLTYLILDHLAMAERTTLKSLSRFVSHCSILWEVSLCTICRRHREDSSKICVLYALEVVPYGMAWAVHWTCWWCCNHSWSCCWQGPMNLTCLI